MKKEEISGSMPTSAPRFSSLREKSIKLILLLKTKPTCGWLRLHKIVGVPPEGVLLHLVHLHLRVNLPTCHLSGRNIVKGTTDPGIACCGDYQSRARQHQVSTSSTKFSPVQQFGHEKDVQQGGRHEGAQQHFQACADVDLNQSW